MEKAAMDRLDKLECQMNYLVLLWLYNTVNELTYTCDCVTRERIARIIGHQPDMETYQYGSYLLREQAQQQNSVQRLIDKEKLRSVILGQ
jgi:hypothetical protein